MQYFHRTNQTELNVHISRDWSQIDKYSVYFVFTSVHIYRTLHKEPEFWSRLTVQ